MSERTASDKTNHANLWRRLFWWVVAHLQACAHATWELLLFGNN